MKDDILSKIKAIRRNAEEELGFALSSAFWTSLEEEEGISYVPGQFDGSPDEAVSFLEEYQFVSQRHIAVLKEEVPLIARQMGVMANTISDKPRRTRKLSRQPFERRLYLFDFICRAKGSLKARGDWTAITEEWNRKHPHNPQSPQNLKSRFWEMKHDDALLLAWVASLLGRLNEVTRRAKADINSVKVLKVDIEKERAEHPGSRSLPQELLVRTRNIIAETREQMEKDEALPMTIEPQQIKTIAEKLGVPKALTAARAATKEFMAELEKLTEIEDMEAQNERINKTDNTQELANPDLHR